MANAGGGVPLHYKRMMVFVDGTNFLCELFRELRIPRLKAAKPPTESFVIANCMVDTFCKRLGIVKIRKYWFSSYQGSEELQDRLARCLRESDFEPVLFRRRNGREKGVDIAIAKEMLVNAFNHNFDIGLLIAGDEDYVGLVTEVKKYGPVVWGSFFSHGLSEKLRITCDQFFDIMDASRQLNQTKKYVDALEALGRTGESWES